MSPPSLRVFSTLALAGVLEEMTPRLADIRLETILAPTAMLLERIRAGETADIALLLSDSVDALAQQGILLSGRTDLARSLVGIAVRAGAPHPDISTVAAFVATMHAAKSLAYSRAGASGLYFAGLLERLHIADAVNAKATVIPSGFTGELVRRGEAEIAVQQISELMVVPGIDIVGTLPPGIEGVSIFSAGIFAASQHAALARSAIARLAAPDAADVFRAKGLEPLGNPASRRSQAE
ncbi:MAG TPA: substrate-binding domain-containing protein [Acetobacteraceae bacterium]|jgi:molybdate transport system substrate-binding protein